MLTPLLLRRKIRGYTRGRTLYLATLLPRKHVRPAFQSSRLSVLSIFLCIFLFSGNEAIPQAARVARASTSSCTVSGFLSKTRTSRIPGIEFYGRSAALIILFRGPPRSGMARDACISRRVSHILTSNVEFLSQLRLVSANLAVHLPVPPTALPFLRLSPRGPLYARPSRTLCSAAITSEVCAHMQRSSIFMLISIRLYSSRVNG